MSYMVGHNASHANELAELAGQLNTMGETGAYEKILAAVAKFEEGNGLLSEVLNSMKG